MVTVARAGKLYPARLTADVEPCPLNFPPRRLRILSLSAERRQDKETVSHERQNIKHSPLTLLWGLIVYPASSPTDRTENYN